MIRINDHIFRVGLIRHVWIVNDGLMFAVAVELDGETTPWLIGAPDRANAEEIMSRVHDGIAKWYDIDDEEDDYESDATL